MGHPSSQMAFRPLYSNQEYSGAGDGEPRQKNDATMPAVSGKGGDLCHRPTNPTVRSLPRLLPRFLRRVLEVLVPLRQCAIEPRDHRRVAVPGQIAVRPRLWLNSCGTPFCVSCVDKWVAPNFSQ